MQHKLVTEFQQRKRRFSAGSPKLSFQRRGALLDPSLDRSASAPSSPMKLSRDRPAAARGISFDVQDTPRSDAAVSPLSGVGPAPVDEAYPVHFNSGQRVQRAVEAGAANVLCAAARGFAVRRELGFLHATATYLQVLPTPLRPDPATIHKAIESRGRGRGLLLLYAPPTTTQAHVLLHLHVQRRKRADANYLRGCAAAPPPPPSIDVGA